jgi:pyridoxine kinase
LISGYLGSPENAEVVREFVAKAKSKNLKLIYLCDPDMGDSDAGYYVGEELRARTSKNLVPFADILTPNQFEPESLAGRKPTTLEDLAAAARGLGPRAVIVTGVCAEDTPPDTILTLAVEREAAWVVATPKLSCSPSGTGDLFAALFAAALVQGFATEAALEQAVSGVFAVLEETTSRGSYEMALVFSAARLLHRSRQFTASPISPRAARSGAGKTPTLSY